MSKCVLLCHRDRSSNVNVFHQVNLLSRRITPDNIDLVESRVITDKGIMMAITPPNELLSVKGTGIAMGSLSSRSDDWNIPYGKIPDGAFALFRWDQDRIELATDMVASRTIWYAHTPDLFLASTSQRAIVYFIESFEPNEEAFLWMLSSGMLGPGLSWDRRIRSVPPNSRLVLDRNSWDISLDTRKTVISPEPLSQNGHRIELEGEIEALFNGLDMEGKEWALTLSGGYDSRMLLLSFLQAGRSLRCVTWGQKKALQNRSSDAYVAGQLCETLGVPHEYFMTDLSSEPVEKIFRRFLVAGEGRIDHIAAYMDGFEMWRTFSQKGIKGIIRGDECFGAPYLGSEFEVREFMGATMFSDFDGFWENGHCPVQTLPSALERGENEALEVWRDRMYSEYLFPYGISALNDLKLPYVEIMIPFISRNIVDRVRRLPDQLRTGKALFKKIVKAKSPSVPFAKYAAIDLERNFLRNERVTRFLLSELESHSNASILPSKMMKMVTTGMRSGAVVHSPMLALLKTVKPFMPAGIIPPLKKFFPFRRTIDAFDLGWRLFIIGEMAATLSTDASVLKRERIVRNYTSPNSIQTVVH